MGQSQSDQKPEPGDLIEIFRGLYLHWAVYVGDGYVVHVTPCVSGEGSSSLRSDPNNKVMVRRQKLQEVAGDSTWRINNMLDKMYEPRPAHIIVEEALRQVGKMMEYSAIKKNCEHFATNLRYRKAVSIQGMVADVATASLYRPGRPPIVAATEAVVELLRRPQTD